MTRGANPEPQFIDGEPPPSRSHQGHPGRWGEAVESLKRSPGTWAILERRLITEEAGSETLFNRLGPVQKRLKRAGCECVIRRVAGEVLLYARWPRGGESCPA